MTTRKSGKDLRKEYQGLLDKTKAMRVRIVKRAESLIKQYPDVVYFISKFPTNHPITVGGYQSKFKLEVQSAMNIIEKIEQHIANQHTHTQMKLFVNKDTPVGERVIVNGKTGEAYTRKPKE